MAHRDVYRVNFNRKQRLWTLTFKREVLFSDDRKQRVIGVARTIVKEWAEWRRSATLIVYDQTGRVNKEIYEA